MPESTLLQTLLNTLPLSGRVEWIGVRPARDRKPCAGLSVTATGRPAMEDAIPDVRDGLTRTERLVLAVLQQTQQECQNRSVPTAMLYGRVVEYLSISEAELIQTLNRLGVQSRGRE